MVAPSLATMSSGTDRLRVTSEKRCRIGYVGKRVSAAPVSRLASCCRARVGCWTDTRSVRFVKRRHCRQRWFAMVGFT